jgi:mRNA-degrading endonuclease HigB of HigAB toxin-antitoxin module
MHIFALIAPSCIIPTPILLPLIFNVAQLCLFFMHAYRKDTSFAELREIFPDADQVSRLTVFNIGGNKIRLISAIHYNRRKVYIRAVLTHEEYSKSRWKE